MHSYSFVVDNGLRVCSRAISEEKALARIQSTWPRSKIELVGIDLESANREALSTHPPKHERTMRKVVAHASPVSESETKRTSRRTSKRTTGDYADAINAAVKDSSADTGADTSADI